MKLFNQFAGAFTRQTDFNNKVTKYRYVISTKYGKYNNDYALYQAGDSIYILTTDHRNGFEGKRIDINYLYIIVVKFNGSKVDTILADEEQFFTQFENPIKETFGRKYLL